MKHGNSFRKSLTLIVAVTAILSACMGQSAFAGSIVAWGTDVSGPSDPCAGNDYVALAAGGHHGLALKQDGSIVGWGADWAGQADPCAGNDYVAIAGGDSHSLALKQDGSMVGWGKNDVWGDPCEWYGQATPPDGNDYVAIAAGHYHSLALKQDGSIVSWGLNNRGQVTDTPDGNNFVAISGGNSHSLALKQDGSIAGWGWNAYGQATPPDGNDYVAIAAGGYHNLALKQDGSIVAWGRDDYGQATPPAGNDFVAIAAGYGHNLALKQDGSIVGWGRNTDYWGFWVFQAIPPAGYGYVAVSAGHYYSLAIAGELNTPPVADAGDDIAVIEIGSLVPLDGSDSYDIDGDDITYLWTMTQKPDGSLAELSDPCAVEPNFIADVHGDYIITLVVTDIFGAESLLDSITVSFDNVKPVAVPGGNQAVVEGDTVLLDGSGSYDGNGDELTYKWNIVFKPSDSNAVLSDSNVVAPSFIADVNGSYVISLVVNDGFVDSNSANVSVMAISNEDAVSMELIEAVDVINALDPNVLKNPNLAGALTNKINDVLESIDLGYYEDALAKLQNDILKKTNGCAESIPPAPDKNDWIETCEEQGQVYPLVLQAIQYLEQALQ